MIHTACSIHSQLLFDSIRVITRLLDQLAQHHPIIFSDHRRRAKRRCLNIRNRRGARRLAAYRDLLKVARKSSHYAQLALQQADQFMDLPSQLVTAKLRRYWGLMVRIIDQTRASYLCR